jgi:hypothetical protein
MIARGQDKTLKTTLNLVRVEGFEPPRPKTVGPKPTAAANYAILAKFIRSVFIVESPAT